MNSRILGKLSISSRARTKFVVGAAVLASMLGFAGVIHAGSRGVNEVTFTGDAANGSFKGSLGSARASSDGYQYIGCQVSWYGPTTANLPTVNPSNYGYCYARDRNGNTRSCYVTVKYGTAAALLGNVSSDAWLYAQYFSMPDAAYCNWIDIANFSYLAPKGS